jgi:hypothetical protein
MNVEGCASRLTRSLLQNYNLARKSTTFADRKVIAGRRCSFTTTNGCEGPQPLYLASQQILAFLSRPKGRNSYGEDLAEEGGKLPRPKLDKKLSWRLAHLPRAVPFLDRTVS